MHKLPLLAGGLALSFNLMAAVPNNEPVQPIEAAKATDPAKVELASSCSSIRACRARASFPVTPATT